MPIDFPSSPTVNQTYTVGSKTWKWSGAVWDLQIPAATMDINGLTAAAPASNDTVPIYDASASANRKAGAAEIASLAIGNSGYRAGEFQSLYGTFTTTASNPIASGSYYLPFVVGKKTTFIAMCYDTTVAEATANARLGIYNAADGLPTTKIMETALSTGVRTVGLTTITISQTLEAGFYFIAFGLDNALNVRQATYNSQMMQFFLGQELHSSGGPTLAYFDSTISTALPATVNAANLTRQKSSAQLVAVWLKA